MRYGRHGKKFHSVRVMWPWCYVNKYNIIYYIIIIIIIRLTGLLTFCRVNLYNVTIMTTTWRPLQAGDIIITINIRRNNRFIVFYITISIIRTI